MLVPSWRSTFCGSHYSLRLKIRDFQISHVCIYCARTEILGEIGVLGFFLFCFWVLWVLLVLESSSSPSHQMSLVSTGLLVYYQKVEKPLHFVILEGFFQNTLTVSTYFPFFKIFKLALFMSILKVSRTLWALAIRKTGQWSLLRNIFFIYHFHYTFLSLPSSVML